LLRYSWPGNVRELEHVIGRAALKLLGRGIDRNDISTISADQLDLVNDPAPGSSTQPATPSPSSTPRQDDGTRPLSLRAHVELLQRERIRQALDNSGDNWAMAARLLDMDPSNLHKLAGRLGLK